MFVKLEGKKFNLAKKYAWLFLFLFIITFSLCGTRIAICVEKNQGYLMKYKFTSGSDYEPAGWISNGDVGARIDPRGRNGARCLAISTYWKESRNPEWISPIVAIDQGFFKISCWMAFSFLYSPDASYGPAVVALEMDANKKELRRVPVIQNLTGNLSLSLVISPEKRNWTYCEVEYAPGPGTHFVRWIFTINNRDQGANGEAWLDDFCVSKAQDQKIVSNKDKSDLRLNLNTEFTLNLFLPEDPLLFDVSIYRRTPGDLSPIDLTDIKLQYVIRDYDNFVLLRGEKTAEGAADVKVTFPEGYTSFRWDRKNYVKVVQIPDLIKKGNIGRYLKIKFTLVKNGHEITSDEKAFGIIQPRYLTPELAEKSKFGGSVGPEIWPGMLDFKRPPIHQQLGLTWIRLYTPFWYGQENPADPLPNLERSYSGWSINSWPAPDSKYFKLHPYSKIHGCYYFYAPSWALLPGKEDILDRIDPVKFQIWIRHVATQTKKLYGDRVKLMLIANENTLCIKGYDTILKESYKTIKEAMPGVDVGIGALGLAGLPSQSVEFANLIEKGALDYCDWIDEHGGRSPEEWEAYYTQMKEEISKRGKMKKLIATEFDTDGVWAGMEKYCRDMIQRHAAAFFAGLDVADWFVFYHMDRDEDGREYSPMGFDQFIYMGDHRPQVSLRNNFINTMNFYPRPCTFTLYNLTHNLDYCKPKEKLKIGPDTTGYLFDIEDHSVAVLWRNAGKGSKTVGLSFDAPSVEVIDMVGRSDLLFLTDGVTTFTITERPQILVFPVEVNYIKVSEASQFKVADEPLIITKGSSNKLVVSVSGIKGILKVDAGLDWIITPSQVTIDLEEGQRKDYVLDISIPSSLPSQSYPVKIYAESNGNLLAALIKTIEVKEQVDFEVTTIPLSVASKPAFVVNLNNFGNKPLKCLVEVNNPVTDEIRTELFTSEVNLKPGLYSQVMIPVEPRYVNLNKTYTVEASLTPEDGNTIKKSFEVSFVGAPRMKKPPVIDGDLSEWDKSYSLSMGILEKWAGGGDWAKLSFLKAFAYDGRQGDFPWKGHEDLSGKFYIGWDENNFYMAVEVVDDIYYNENVNGLCWNGDAIEVGMYPAWKVTGSRFSDEAFAKTKLGNQMFRGMTAEGGGLSGMLVNDVKLAVRIEKGKRTYELAWPREAWKPLEFKPWTRFRLNVLAMEEDFPGGQTNRWENRWICWFPGLSSDKNPKQFGLVTLVP